MRVTNEERITPSADDIDATREPAQAGRQPVEEPEISPEQDQWALEEEGYGYGV
jgi:hypothetical protein